MSTIDWQDLFYDFKHPITPEKLSELLDQHPTVDINEPDAMGRYSLIQYCCRMGKSDLIAVLLKRKDLNVTNQRIYYYANRYVKDLNVLTMVLERLKQQSPDEYKMYHFAEEEEKRIKDELEAKYQAFSNQQNEYIRAGAKTCKRCGSLFFEDKSKQQPLPFWKDKENNAYYQSWEYQMFHEDIIDDSKILPTTVCIGHTGGTTCKSMGFSFPGCCIYTCCKLPLEHPGCTQYSSHI